MDSTRDFKALAEDFVKRGILKDVKQFNSRIVEQVKDVMRSTLLVTKRQ